MQSVRAIQTPRDKKIVIDGDKETVENRGKHPYIPLKEIVLLLTCKLNRFIIKLKMFYFIKETNFLPKLVFQMEVKVYKQKVKHLLYEQENHLAELKAESMVIKTFFHFSM